MADLELAEAKHGLTPDGLSYQQRCSRITFVLKGEVWPGPKDPEIKNSAPSLAPRETMTSAVSRHPLMGKRILITPLMVPDKNRALYYDEPVGHEIEVEEVSAGEMIYDKDKSTDRMLGDYRVISENVNRVVMARTSIPKIGQEISWLIGKELVPVVRGNDNQRGYIWSLPPHMRQYEDTMIQIFGLSTLINQVAPELLSKFSGKPVMMYVDGMVLAASIPQTDAIIKAWRLEEMKNARLGLE
jgi:hypothetical protein